MDLNRARWVSGRRRRRQKAGEEKVPAWVFFFWSPSNCPSLLVMFRFIVLFFSSVLPLILYIVIYLY